MPQLDPQVAASLELIGQLPKIHDMTPEDARAHARMLAELDGGREPVAGVEDRAIPGPDGQIPIRVYSPDSPPPLPILVYFHGGGHTIGDLETHDGVCRTLCRAAECVVVAVDYRLGPENRFPAAVDDAFAAVTWVAEHAVDIGGQPGSVGVGGDSAGGNLATVVCLLARDQGGPQLALQLLVYPVTDFATHLREPDRTASSREFAEGYFHEFATMQYYARHYLASDSDIDNPLASPLRAESLEDLPPALVVTAGFDPLRDEGEAYARRLEAAGVPTTLRRYQDLTHAFLNMHAVYDRAGEARDEIVVWLRATFAQR